MKQYKRVGWAVTQSESNGGIWECTLAPSKQISIDIAERYQQYGWRLLKKRGYFCISPYADTDDLKGKKK